MRVFIDGRFAASAALAFGLFLLAGIAAGVANATIRWHAGDDDLIFASGLDEVFPPYPPAFALVAPDSAIAGLSFNVRWSVSGATECSGSALRDGVAFPLPGWTDSLAPTSPRTVIASTPGTYQLGLACSNTAGSVISEPANVSVAPPSPPMPPGFVLRLPGTIEPGVPFDIAWSVTGATMCAGSALLDGTSTPLHGWTDVSTPTSPRRVTVPTTGRYTFSLTCMNPYGSVASMPASVGTPGGPPWPDYFELMPSTTHPGIGETFTVDAHVLAATSCVGTAERDGRNASLAGWTDTTSVVLPRRVVASIPGYYLLRMRCSNEAGAADSQPLQVAVGGAVSDAQWHGRDARHEPSSVIASSQWLRRSHSIVNQPHEDDAS